MVVENQDFPVYDTQFQSMILIRKPVEEERGGTSGGDRRKLEIFRALLIGAS